MILNNTLRVLQKAFSSEKLQLPKKPLDESRLPFPISSNIFLEKYNTFIESEEISGYKLDYKKDTVYIVELCLTEHEAVVDIIGKYFNALCPGMYSNAPIQVRGQPLHDAPDGVRKAPDLAVYPHRTFVPAPPVPGPPPSDRRGNPYARVMLEVAVTQSSSDLKDKCRLWKRQSYVRSVLGIKLYDVLATRNAAGDRDRAMKWRFGTVNKDGSSTDATGCNAANDPNYIINIPVSDIFYDPAIAGYTPLARPPAVLYNAIVAIDLYEVQRF